MNKSDKLVVIHQPDFAPYLGFFHRLMLADIYVVLDNVQFIRGGSNCWTNRDKIKTSNGEQWLTIPCHKAPLGTNINEIKINDNIDWRTRNLSQIENNYKKAFGFKEVFPYIKELYKNHDELLWKFNLKSIEMLIKLFGIDIKIKVSSDLNPIGTSNERVVDIVKRCGAKRYLSGIGARDYFDQTPFDNAGIEVVWQEFEHPVYNQLNGEFIPYLSSIDLLLNCGIDESRRVLKSTINKMELQWKGDEI